MSQDLALALQSAARQPTAFDTVYAYMAPRVLGYLARRTFDVQVAADLTAETMARAFAGRKRFRGATDAEAAGWIFGIAANVLGRWVRTGVVERSAIERLGIRTPELAEDDYERIVELAGLSELRARVAEAFGGLSPDQRDALRLRVIDECSYADVAARLGVSEQTARARVSRALRQLAEAAELSTLREVEIS